MRCWFDRKAVMRTLAVRRVSDQAGNPGIYSLIVRFSFVRWFRDPLLPGHHDSRFSYTWFFKACFLYEKLSQQHWEQ